MADFFNNGLKKDDWWSKEGRFEEVHLCIVSQILGLKSLEERT